MTHRIVSRVVALSFAFAALLGTAHADSVSGNFLHNDNSPSGSGGSVTFALNGDGSIAASLTSLVGGIVGFGFNSVPQLPESGFPPGQPANSFGWGSSWYGNFSSGFLANSPYPTAISWTIGNPGDFTSVSQALGGPNPDWDFFLYNEGGEWAAVAAVPELETYALMSLGLAVLLVLRRRDRQV